MTFHPLGDVPSAETRGIAARGNRTCPVGRISVKGGSFKRSKDKPFGPQELTPTSGSCKKDYFPRSIYVSWSYLLEGR